MNGKSDINDDSQLDAAAILLSLKTTPPSFQKKLANHGKSSEGLYYCNYIICNTIINYRFNLYLFV